MQSYNKYNWKEDKLYLYTNDTGLSVVKDEIPNMWRIKFQEGDLSLDYYNRTRAKDNTVGYHQTHDKNAGISPVETFK